MCMFEGFCVFQVWETCALTLLVHIRHCQLCHVHELDEEKYCCGVFPLIPSFRAPLEVVSTELLIATVGFPQRRRMCFWIFAMFCCACAGCSRYPSAFVVESHSKTSFGTSAPKLERSVDVL